MFEIRRESCERADYGGADGVCPASRRGAYLEPDPLSGRLSKALLLPLLREFIARRRAFANVDRRK
jgi:hypothetical protein